MASNQILQILKRQMTKLINHELILYILMIDLILIGYFFLHQNYVCNWIYSIFEKINLFKKLGNFFLQNQQFLFEKSHVEKNLHN